MCSSSTMLFFCRSPRELFFLKPAAAQERESRCIMARSSVADYRFIIEPFDSDLRILNGRFYIARVFALLLLDWYGSIVSKWRGLFAHWAVFLLPVIWSWLFIWSALSIDIPLLCVLGRRHCLSWRDNIIAVLPVLIRFCIYKNTPGIRVSVIDFCRKFL